MKFAQLTIHRSIAQTLAQPLAGLYNQPLQEVALPAKVVSVHIGGGSKRTQVRIGKSTAVDTKDHRKNDK